MSPTIDWLLREGAGASSAGSLLGEVCNRVTAEGLPLARALLRIASLDPLVARSHLRWRRDDGRVIEEVQLHGMSTVNEVSADCGNMRWCFTGTSHEIDWITDQSGGFGTTYRNYLQGVCIAMGAPLQVVVGREITRNLLQAYLGRRSADTVLNGTVRRGTGEMIEAVIWISDMRDFTRLSEDLLPDQVIRALNDCCARLVGAIQPFGGEVLKFIGDGLLAIFPLSTRGAAAACDAALTSVRAARQGMARLDDERRRAGLPPLPFGVALHLGAVMYGNIGAPDRLDFTAIGSAVNVASRIEGLCRHLGCPVLISKTVASRCSQSLAPMGSHSMRGVDQPLALFTLPEVLPVRGS
jgi:adenylate cyclase